MRRAHVLLSGRRRSAHDRPIVLNATGGLLLLSGTTTATLEIGMGAPPPVVRAGPGPPLEDRRRGRIELIDEEDWIELQSFITEIINAGR